VSFAARKVLLFGWMSLLSVASGADARPSSAEPVRVAILCYHDLAREPGANPLTVSPDALRDQIRSAKASGWEILPLSTVLARAESGEALPARVLVLTFDDGYASFLREALPILRAENAPATLAIVSAFTDAPPRDLPPLLSWKQIREAKASGLVEIASHTHDLHRWVQSNPYRDTRHAVSTREYLPSKARYETRDEYRARIGADLRRAQELLRAKLGAPASTLVWPYGEHTEMARGEAAEAGFRATLALGDREASLADLRAGLLPRILVTRDTPRAFDGPGLARTEPVRAVRLDLDSVFDRDEATLRANVDRMIAEARRLGANLVVLQGFADPQADGRLRESWFVNHQVPAKADLWSMVAEKLHHAGLKVWMRAPTMSRAWDWERHPEWRIPREDEKGAPLPPRGFRLSPDIPAVRQAALDLYTDIAVYLPIDGVLFDDDLFLKPEERLAESGAGDPGAKSEAMRELTAGVMRAVRAWRPNAKFGRTIDALAVAGDGPNRDVAQDLGMFLRTYDLTVVAIPPIDTSGRSRLPAGRKLARVALARWKQSGPAPLLFLFDPYGEVPASQAPELVVQTRNAREAGVSQVGLRLDPSRTDVLPKNVLGAGLAATVPRKGRARAIPEDAAAPHP